MSLATDQNSTADNEKTTEERIENLPQREGIFASGITWDAALAVLVSPDNRCHRVYYAH